MFDYNMRLVLIGECSVGKTAFASKLTYGYYHDKHNTTIGVDYSAKTIPINNEAMVKCQLWDTAGQENFAPIIKNYYKGVASGFLVIDATDTEWKNHMEKWLKRYNAHKFEESLPLIAILNKIDLERKVSFEEFKLFADENGMKSYEISVKTGANTKYLLDKMTEYILEHIEKGSKLPGVKKGIDIRQIEEKFQPEQGLYDKCCIVQ